MFKVTLTTSQKKHSQQAKTIDTAIANMGLSWNDVKAKGVILVTKGKKSHEHVFNLFQLRKIFGNKLTRASWSSKLEFLLKEGNKTNIPK